MRSFLAITPDDAARSGLAELLAGLERVAASESPALRWSRAASIHLTLHFLGDVDETREATLSVQLEEPLATPPFDVTLGQLGTFPPGRPPRVFWVAVDQGRDEMIAIHAELGRRLKTAGLALEGRPFTPHLTLARVRDGELGRARKVTQRLTRVQVPPLRWHVDRVTLYHSDLSGPAPRYDAVKHVPLRGSASGRRE